MEKFNPSIFSNERIILEAVIKRIASHNLHVTFSLNIINAINAVATISKFPSKDAFDEVPYFTPSINKIGATISRKIIPIVYGK